MNVFVTVGTTEFSNLIKNVDLKIGQMDQYDVEAQIGTSKYIPKYINYYRYTDYMADRIEWADIVITHGGAGTVYDLLEKQKKTIVVPNPNVRGNHQIEIANFVNENNFAIALRNQEGLLDALSDCKNKSFESYSNNSDDLINFLAKKINR